MSLSVTGLLIQAVPGILGARGRQVKRRALADRPTRAIEDSALQACQAIFHMTPTERLRKAGVLSGNFWLTN